MIKKILLLALLPVYLFAWKMESGKTTLPATTVGSTEWKTVTLQQSYDSVPLIFAMPDEGSGYAADTPAALRVRNIGLNSFEIVQVEPQPDDGAHASMTIHYIAIEPGNHTLHDGTRFLAGSEVDVLDNWQTVNFSPAFTYSPVMLAMIQSMNNEDDAFLPGQASVPWMVAGLRNIGTNSFETFLDKVKTAGTIISNETVGYLAISGSSASSVSGSFDSTNKQCIQYETKLTPNSVNGWGDECYVQGLNTYSDTPNVIASMQTRSGGDGGWVRRCSISSSSVGVTIDEDNTNRTHGVNETVGLAVFSKDFIFDSAKYNNSCIVDPVVDYRMDECYWLGNAGGVTGDIKDSSPSFLDGTSYASAQTMDTVGVPPMCKIGTFNGTSDYLDVPDNVVLTTTNNYTVSTWLKPNLFTNTFEVFVMKTTNYRDGFTLYIYWDGNDPSVGLVSLQTGDGTNSDNVLSTINADEWTHITATYDGTTLRMYINGVEISTTNFSTTITNASVPLVTGVGLGGNFYYNGAMDELKIFDTTLSAVEINTLYNNEVAGKNYNETTRECNTCDATISANSWELVGIPIDLRTDPKTVADTFQGMTGTYDTNWRVYRRDYSDTNNSSWYTYLNATDPMEFGKGYWLGNALSADETWNVNGAQAVDYNSTFNGTTDCVANRCVEIDVKSVTNDFDDGTGPYRYNMTGFTGKSPVAWADCRFIIDGTAYTPTAAENAGYTSKVIWQYNPGDTGADANGYTSCDDTTPGTCLLEPYKGFWVELHGSTKNIPVKLLIPQE